MTELFEPYKTYSTTDIILEIVAVLLALASVLYSKKNNIKLYPTGIISTLIFVFLLYKWQLYGDMIINIYYFVMSVYGWLLWSSTSNNRPILKVTKTTFKDYRTAVLLFFFSSTFITLVYYFFDKFGVWWSYVDILTTGLFFVGMYLLAKRKVEHWVFLIVGDIISIPLYYYKGYTITAILYVAYTVIAVFGFLEWKKIWKKENQDL